MKIDLRKLRVWYRWRRRQKTIKRLQREEAARIAIEIDIERDIYHSAVQDILLTHGPAPGGVIIIDKIKNNIERRCSINTPAPRSKRDLINDCEWWEIDTSNAYNNSRKLSMSEITAYLRENNE